MLYGGSIAPGRWRGKDVTIQDVFEGIGAHAAGDLSGRRAARPREPREPGRRRLRRPVHRQHDGDGVRGARHLADGQLDGARRGRQEGTGRRGLRPARARGARDRTARRRRSSRATPSRTRSPPARCRAAPPTSSCTCSPWRTRRASSSTSRTSTGSPGSTPLLCDLKPGGRYVATDLYRAGGVPLVDPPAAGGRPAPRGRAHRHRPDDRRGGGGGRGDRGPGRRAHAGRRAEAEWRLRDPARQPRARGLRREAVRATTGSSTAARRACSSARRTPSAP